MVGEEDLEDEASRPAASPRGGRQAWAVHSPRASPQPRDPAPQPRPKGATAEAWAGPSPRSSLQPQDLAPQPRPRSVAAEGCLPRLGVETPSSVSPRPGSAAVSLASAASQHSRPPSAGGPPPARGSPSPAAAGPPASPVSARGSAASPPGGFSAHRGSLHSGRRPKPPPPLAATPSAAGGSRRTSSLRSPREDDLNPASFAASSPGGPGAFAAAMRRAEEEGLDLFAHAPLPTFKGTAPGLTPPHGRASGMVQSSGEAKMLDKSLAGDYFKRPAWNCSVLPEPPAEDRRSLETVARQRRERAVELQLARRQIRLVGLCSGDRRSVTPSCGRRPSTRRSSGGTSLCESK